MAEPPNATPGDRGERDDLPFLLDLGRSEPRVAAAMAVDLDAFVREHNLLVDPTTEAYQELSVRLYHLRNVLGGEMGDLLDRHFGRELPDFDPFAGYGKYVAGESPFSPPGTIDIERLKREIGGGGPERG